MLATYYNIYHVELISNVAHTTGLAIGKRVRRLRKHLGISQRMLSERAGISDSYISQLESGKIPNPTITQLRKVANGLKATLEEITGGELPDDAVIGKSDVELRADEITRKLLALPDEAMKRVEAYLNYEWKRGEQ